MFFPGTFHSWLDLLYSDWKSSLKRKSTFTIPTITRSGKAKKETSKSESCEAQTVQTNAMVLPTSTYLHIVIPFNWNVKVIVRQETTGFISTGFYFLQPQAYFTKHKKHKHLHSGWPSSGTQCNSAARFQLPTASWSGANQDKPSFPLCTSSKWETIEGVFNTFRKD